MIKRAVVVSLLGLLAMPALADEVRIEQAWARATAPGQRVASAFMDLTADADMRLVGAASPAAESVELHTMSLEGGMMRMRPVRDIPLPQGRTVSLAPGGLHLMLIDIKAPLREGAAVPVTLKLRDSGGKEKTLQVQAEVRRPGGEAHHHH